MIGDVAVETHQLIQPLPVDDTVAVGVGVDTVIGGRRMAIDQAEIQGVNLRRRSPDLWSAPLRVDRLREGN